MYYLPIKEMVRVATSESLCLWFACDLMITLCVLLSPRFCYVHS